MEMGDIMINMYIYQFDLYIRCNGNFIKHYKGNNMFFYLNHTNILTKTGFFLKGDHIRIYIYSDAPDD